MLNTCTLWMEQKKEKNLKELISLFYFIRLASFFMSILFMWLSIKLFHWWYTTICVHFFFYFLLSSHVFFLSSTFNWIFLPFNFTVNGFLSVVGFCLGYVYVHNSSAFKSCWEFLPPTARKRLSSLKLNWLHTIFFYFFAVSGISWELLCQNNIQFQFTFILVGKKNSHFVLVTNDFCGY